jgi:hypothetical protein
MGKHENGYARVARDIYPTRQPWITQALLGHVDIVGRNVLEPAAGEGNMAEVLKAAGAARVYTNDIEDRGYPLDRISDFTAARIPGSFDAVITNPPQGGRSSILFKRFIATGLDYIAGGGVLALLLPVDFDSGKTRIRFFRDCPQFALKIVLLGRPIWFERRDGEKEQPKENSAWFVWDHAHAGPPRIAYALEPGSRSRRGGADRPVLPSEIAA